MLSIDRFEGEYAVCEEDGTERQRKLPKVLLPQGAREGDCIAEEAGEWHIDVAETLRRRKHNQELLSKLYN